LCKKFIKKEIWFNDPNSKGNNYLFIDKSKITGYAKTGADKEIVFLFSIISKVLRINEEYLKPNFIKTNTCLCQICLVLILARELT
jgi:nucleosome binding factor SPN SPT16 subunit